MHVLSLSFMNLSFFVKYLVFCIPVLKYYKIKTSKILLGLHVHVFWYYGKHFWKCSCVISSRTSNIHATSYLWPYTVVNMFENNRNETQYCGCRSWEVCGVHEEVEPAPVVTGRGRVHHQKRGPVLDLRDLHSSGSGDCQR